MKKLRKLNGIKLYIQVILNPLVYQKSIKKKRENFRNKCEKYIITDSTLYKKDKNYEKNSIKYRIPFETEKINLIKKIHLENGHLEANEQGIRLLN